MAVSTPKLHVRLNRHQDGTRFIAISRGSMLWFRITLDEAPDLADALIDLHEQSGQDTTNDR